MAEKNSNAQEKEPLAFGYGTCFFITTLPALFYLASRGSYYRWRGGLFYSIFDIVGDIFLCLLVMVPGAAILRLLLRRPKVWHGVVLAVLLIAWCGFCSYRSTLPVPYLRDMMEEMPRAVEYFQAHKTELDQDAQESNNPRFLYEPPADSPAYGYGHDMCFYYVEDPANYPEREGQLGISAYIRFLDEHWYLYMDSLLGG